MSDPFTDRALKIYEDAKTQIGYVAHRFRQKMVRDGGLAAAKHWLRPSKVTTGFQRLRSGPGNLNTPISGGSATVDGPHGP